MASVILWKDEDLALFEEELTNLLDDERSLPKDKATVTRKLVDKSSTALRRMVNHHHELKHMHDIERRQIDEIDHLREKWKESQNKTDHLQGVRKELEACIADLRAKLAFSRNESAERQAVIDVRDKQMEEARANAKTDKQAAVERVKELEAKKDVEIGKLNEEIGDLKATYDKMASAVSAAEKGTAALKNALNVCQETLQEAI